MVVATKEKVKIKLDAPSEMKSSYKRIYERPCTGRFAMAAAMFLLE